MKKETTQIIEEIIDDLIKLSNEMTAELQHHRASTPKHQIHNHLADIIKSHYRTSIREALHEYYEFRRGTEAPEPSNPSVRRS